MEVLKLSVNYLIFLGILSHRLDEPTNEFYKTLRTYFFLFCHTCPILIASTVFIIHNFSNIVALTNALVIFSAGVSCFGAYMWIGIHMPLVKSLYIDFKEVTTKAKENIESMYYAEAERKGTKYVKTISVIFLTHISTGVFGMAIMNALYNICVGNHHPETWYLPYMISLPFDRSTYMGYLLSLLAQMMAGYTYILTMSAVTTYFLACCFYIEACIQHLQYKIENLDIILENERNKIDQLRDIVQFHVVIIEMHEKLRTIATGPIFFQLVSNAVFFASSIFQIGMTKSLFEVELAYNLLCLFTGLIWTYLYCYYATQTTFLMVEVTDVIWSSQWYTYPTYMRKYLLLILLRSQIAVDFHGFKIVRCSLETFRKILNTATSYALMFRKFANH